MKKKGLIISIIICIVLGAGFSYVYFHDHAWGTWGDDSAGYIYLWGKMDQSKPLVYQEDLAVKALEHFGDEKLARWTTPTHHEIISPSGYIASKYPIGLSIVMYVFSTILGSGQAIYYVLPVLAMLNLILVYLIADIIFKDIKYRQFFSLFAAITLGLTSLFYNYAIAQPMREIPSMFFILAGYYFILLFIDFKVKRSRLAYGFLILSALFLGYSVNIRETSVVVIPAFLILLMQLWNKKENKKYNFKQLLKICLICLPVFVLALLPSIINSVNITEYKEKFKKKDISAIAITSNFDHISSFSLQNVFNNQGKFRPGQGGLPHYWKIIREMSALPYFIILTVIGLIYLYKRNKWLSASLLLWVLTFLSLFSAWINPYSRYIMPLFPMIAILGSFGLYNLLFILVPKFFVKKRDQIIVGVIILLSIIVVYQPVIADIKINFTELEDGEETMVYKSIAKQDLDNLIDLGNRIKAEKFIKKPLIIYTGSWQYGVSETFEAHTGLQSIRMPFEQNKFVFDFQQVKDYFDKYLIDDYNVYIWLDSTTKPGTREFLKQYNLENSYNYSFTFEEAVNIYAITKQN